VTSFLKNVSEALPRLQNECGFVAARKLAIKDFVSFVKRHSEDAYFYVFVNDGRSGNAPLDVSLWVAPPHTPDDGLDNLYVGFKTRIAESFSVTDEFFHRCDDRIVQLIPHLDGLAERVTRELHAPSFLTKRLQVYRIERRVYAVLRAAAERALGPALDALRAGKSVAQGISSFTKLEEACAAAGKALNEAGLFETDIMSFYDGNFGQLGDALAGHIYVRALVEE
jgi:hypothetical protein